MPDLLLHGRQIESVFQLLDEHENDMTYSLGWALAQSPRMLTRFLEHLGCDADPSSANIELQSHRAQEGVTDIEIVLPAALHIIVEAKRGWTLPSRAQLDLYAARLAKVSHGRRLIVALSECTQPYVEAYLQVPEIRGIETRSMAWRDVVAICGQAAREGSHAEKRLLSELGRFLERMTTMQPIDSNMVYVVALGAGGPAGWDLSWIDIVNERRRYFHPIGGRSGWPKEPPNYVAFRYGRKLRSIHHVESYEAVREMPLHFPDAAPKEEWPPHFLYKLGPGFGPGHDIPTGKIYPNGRVWCMLDTLFTSESISAARDLTRARLRTA